MTIKVNPNNLSIQADPQLLDQVLINLIKNALDALKGESEASIQLHASKDDMGEVQLLIQDNGPGIPQDLREKIFIPFYTTKENGSGIGLSLSRQIMLKHGGNLVLDSEEGVGSTFLLQFE
jgi:signal transduction histidine kinase